MVDVESLVNELDVEQEESAPKQEVAEKQAAEVKTEADGEEAKPEEERQETPEEREARRSRNRAKREAGRLRRELEDARVELEVLKRQREAAQSEGQEGDAEAEVERLVQERLSKKLEEVEYRSKQASFVERLNTEKADLPEDFDELLGEIQDVKLDAKLQEALFVAERPGALLYHLADNPSEIERLSELSPVKLGIEIAKITSKQYRKSSAPPPARTVSTSANNSGIPHSEESADDWIDKQILRRGR